MLYITMYIVCVRAFVRVRYPKKREEIGSTRMNTVSRTASTMNDAMWVQRYIYTHRHTQTKHMDYFVMPQKDINLYIFITRYRLFLFDFLHLCHVHSVVLDGIMYVDAFRSLSYITNSAHKSSGEMIRFWT